MKFDSVGKSIVLMALLWAMLCVFAKGSEVNYYLLTGDIEARSSALQTKAVKFSDPQDYAIEFQVLPEIEQSKTFLAQSQCPDGLCNLQPSIPQEAAFAYVTAAAEETPACGAPAYSPAEAACGASAYATGRSVSAAGRRSSRRADRLARRSQRLEARATARASTGRVGPLRRLLGR
jgi:hypothetical protein